ncbi:MAG TPA: hypothetical protein PKZ25_13455, partial [Candidatus Hydrogenedentes bacterium]|nr:hypothetical protein [Candidatus Hydrogenedentota bacterium]
TWPKTMGPDERRPQAFLDNYTGTARRYNPLAEVARRDPSWLAALALDTKNQLPGVVTGAKGLEPRAARLLDILRTCERARYAGETLSREAVEPLLDSARESMEHLDLWLRKESR